MTPQQIDEFFKRFASQNPVPITELHYVNEYTLLVAVVLSAQATDKGVNKATESLFAVVKTPEDLVDLGLEKLTDALKTLNLYKTKAKHVFELSQRLIAEHNSKVPQNRQVLMELPGVGRKTANVVLSVLFNQAVIAVDTHIFRVANRTGLAPGKTPLKVEEGLEAVIPQEYLVNAHHWLILHGRYVCKAQKPLCSQCLVADLCTFEGKKL